MSHQKNVLKKVTNNMHAGVPDIVKVKVKGHSPASRIAICKNIVLLAAMAMRAEARRRCVFCFSQSSVSLFRHSAVCVGAGWCGDGGDKSETESLSSIVFFCRDFPEPRLFGLQSKKNLNLKFELAVILNFDRNLESKIRISIGIGIRNKKYFKNKS